MKQNLDIIPKKNTSGANLHTIHEKELNISSTTNTNDAIGFTHIHVTFNSWQYLCKIAGYSFIVPLKHSNIFLYIIAF